MGRIARRNLPYLPVNLPAGTTRKPARLREPSISSIPSMQARAGACAHTRVHTRASVFFFTRAYILPARLGMEDMEGLEEPAPLSGKTTFHVLEARWNTWKVTP